MKHNTDNVTQSEPTVNTDEWAVRVYDYNQGLSLTLKSSHRRAIWTSAIAGLIIAIVGFTLPYSASRGAVEAAPTTAPLQLD
ncbi:hypothetical protein N836_28190 [Leptolyngbya sp. Heron Island J]|uniref:hypothetical protein n=1 Tax=Leptolyngbya sp. Heron Island J TaxID=1385935 RepID=UPI0003B97432|nr:hypothetical protein [Leptolyngbya sp. Heron Island J]ESA32037.1 hypothetical protein N836_28190 [Leptolyngbya sp. Heron Island J]